METHRFNSDVTADVHLPIVQALDVLDHWPTIRVAGERGEFVENGGRSIERNIES